MIAKAAIELGLWVAVVYAIFAFVVLSPVNYQVSLDPGDTVFLTQLVGGALAIFGITYCWSTEWDAQ